MISASTAIVLCSMGLPNADESTLPWAERYEWRASTFGTSAQHEAAIDVDDADQITVAWSSRRQQDGRSGVYLQRFERDGIAIGGEQRVNLWTQSHEISPAVDSANGLTWVVWQSHGRDGQGASIMARVFQRDSQGNLVGGDEIVINQDWLGDQTNPSVATAHDGSAMIVWTSAGAAGGIDHELSARARVFDAQGRPLTDEFSVSAESEAVERLTSSPCVTFLAKDDGVWMMAYAASSADHSPSGVAVRRFDMCGVPIGDAIDLSEITSTFAVEPVIAAGDSGFMLAWCSPNRANAGGGNYSVVAQALSESGAPMGKTMTVHSQSEGHRNAPAITAMGDEFVIAWNGTGQGSDIVGKRFSEHGTSIGDEFTITKHVKGSQAMRAAAGTARLAMNSRGDLFCGWNGDGDFGDDTAVHVTMQARMPLELAGRTQGIDAARQAGAARAAENVDKASATPYVPPTFDRSRIEKGVREIQEGITEIGFTGILNTGWTPPDSHLAVGPNHLVGITNGEIAFFDKSGALLFQDEIEGPAGFWGPLGATNFVFDPEVLYDPLPANGGRFWAMASETIGAQSKSFVLLAVSDDSDPNGTWHKYRIETTALAGVTFDSPNFGVDELLVYVTGDGTTPGSIYPVYVFSKPVMMAGDPASIVQSLLMPTSTESAGIPPVNFDRSGPLYMIEHGESPTNTSVRLIAMTNQATGPTFTTMQLTVPVYTAPEDPPQMGTTVRPETFDARFWSVAYRNGSLWATHHVGTARVLVRWYEVAMNGWPTSGQQPALVQSGTIDPGGTARTFFSAITADDDNNAALVFARSSPTEFISMQTAYRYASDPLGTFQAPITRQTNVGAYTTNRWGDYAGINVDPVDGLTMWAHHEYALSNSWRTWIQSFYPGNPCPPDIDADGDVDVDDLLAVINAWGPCIGCDADIAPPQGNNMVDVDDLLLVINSWGGCS